MQSLTALYQALTNARKTVLDIERAIEQSTQSPLRDRDRYYSKFSNADSNGNYIRNTSSKETEKGNTDDK